MQGFLYSAVSYWGDCSFQSNTGDYRGNRVMPIRALREQKKSRWVWWRRVRRKKVQMKR